MRVEGLNIWRHIGAGATVLVAGLLHMPAYGVTAITIGNTRLEFLTPSLIRMQYSPDRSFIDGPTAIIEKRDWSAVPVASKRANGWLIASTSAITVQYHLNSGSFTAKNLRVIWKDNAGAAREWHPGMSDTENLGGLAQSLDRISAATLANYSKNLGLLSRSGFALLDDSGSPVWNPAHNWIEPRPGLPGKDWYLFTYPGGYSQVLKEYAELCGPVPMIPRYALGNWITDLNFQYFPYEAQSRSPAFRGYDQLHVEREVLRLLENGVPVTGVVFDFGWHDNGWAGGYDWSGLIPHPRVLSTWLHDRGIRLALNDHPEAQRMEQRILLKGGLDGNSAAKALGQMPPRNVRFDLGRDGLWKVADDPGDLGLREHWYALEYNDRNWKVGADLSPFQPWQMQDFTPHRSIRWYRASVLLRSSGVPLYLYFGQGATSNYQLFVNGKRVKDAPIQIGILTYTDIEQEAKLGRNVIALRIEANYRGEGDLRAPMGLQTEKPSLTSRFNLTDQRQAQMYIANLREPMMRDGVDFWWIDGGAAVERMAGLNAQLWTNRLYYDYEERTTRRRAFILSRYGGWGSERYPAFFTGDTFSEWKVLAYEVAFTARGANVLMPYISNDIGGYHGGKIPFELYARWIEFGAFSPILRMHSQHENPVEGNLRMPWMYGAPGVALMRKYFSLRLSLVPYIYTYSWVAHRDSMPIVRPLYIQWPDLAQAYRYPGEYYFGSEMLVAPVLNAAGKQTVYLPPGRWIGFFDGKEYRGNTTLSAHYAVDQTPVFVRAGAIIPEQPADTDRRSRAPNRLILNIYGSGNGRFSLYEDDGISLLYKRGRYALTSMKYTTSGGRHEFILGPTEGAYSGQAMWRSYEVRIHDLQRPESVAVDGRKTDGWTWNAERSVASVRLPRQSIRRQIALTW